jgi:drug/metabolite transporter (DMT)-like permease
MTTPKKDPYPDLSIPGAIRRGQESRRRRRRLEFIIGALFGFAGIWMLSLGVAHVDDAPAWSLVVMLLGAFFVFAGGVLVGDLK